MNFICHAFRLAVVVALARTLYADVAAAAPTPVDTTVPDDGSRVQLLYPIGGEVFRAGDTIVVRWRAVDTLVERACLTMTCGSGASTYRSYDPLGCIDYRDAEWESRRLPITPSAPTGVPCRIHYDNYTGDARDSTQGTFVIFPRDPNRTLDTTLPSNGRVVEVTSPNGGETFHIGDTMTIRWRADDLAFAECALLSISIDGGRSYHPIENYPCLPIGDPDWENFGWVIPDTFYGASAELVDLRSDRCIIMVSEFGEGQDRSDSQFTIEPRSNMVVRRSGRRDPEGGTVWLSGSRSIAIASALSPRSRIELYDAKGTRMGSFDGTAPGRFGAGRHLPAPGARVVRVMTGATEVIAPAVVTGN